MNIKKEKNGRFRKSLLYLAENKKYIYLIIWLFLVFVAFALIFPAPQSLYSQIVQFLKELSAKTAGLNTFGLIAFIFKNNLFVSLVGIFLGTFFAIVPFILIVSNGYVLGFVIKKLFDEVGFVNGLFNLWKLLPHGIFEIPAVMISLGLGTKLGFVFFNCLYKKSFKDFWKNLWKVIDVILMIIIPLLLIAAIIEGSLIGLLR
jgi:stage II sporulation protein M